MTTAARTRTDATPVAPVDGRPTEARDGMAAHVAALVADAPPLNAAQRDRIALLFRGGTT